MEFTLILQKHITTIYFETMVIKKGEGAQGRVKASLIRQHLALIRQLIQEKYSSTTPKSIRTIDPNNHSDTETGTLFISICTKMKTKSSSKFRGCTNCTETGTSGD